MSDADQVPGSDNQLSHNDGAADALAAVALITIAVATAVFWLSNL